MKNKISLKTKLYYVPKFDLSMEAGDYCLIDIEYTENLDKLREITFWNMNVPINLDECVIKTHET